MPCHPHRAKELIKRGKAIPRWHKLGIFYIKLTQRVDGETGLVVLALDPGSKKEGYTIKSPFHTYLNIQVDAVTWVMDAMETRQQMRRGRRQRNTPCRPNRCNRTRAGLPPSTKARWQAKIRIIRLLCEIYPISIFVVEDIATRTTGKRRWDKSFSPLEVGKNWFYDELRKLGEVITKKGFETKALRDELGLKKSANKTANRFDAHCVDSWVLANSVTGGHRQPDNTSLLLLTPLQFHRRQLHLLQPAPGSIRRRYGGTRSNGLKRGSLVRHTTYGLTYVGGYLGDRISLHDLRTGRRLTQMAKPADCLFSAYSTWRGGFLPEAKDFGVSAAR